MLQSLREFYLSGKTIPESFRINCLQKLKHEVLKREGEILDALNRDLGKPAIEAYASELGYVLSEIRHALKHLHTWMKKQKVKTPLMFWPSKSYIKPIPKGVVLILGPWNYPFQLLMVPLVGALAAGNCTVLKPSQHTPETSRIIESIVNNIFDPGHCIVVPGSEKRARELIEMKWDHIFFTGSTEVGRKIMIRAAENLTPVTLELGGKNPCIVFDDADLNVSAERIAWGKFLNAGQTCIAPDTVYCHDNIHKGFIETLQKVIARFYGPDPAKSPDYGRIINRHHVRRLASYLDCNCTIVTGGRYNEKNLYFEPTIVENIPDDSSIMKEEIFGPVLPVLNFRDVDALISKIQNQPNPLALYIFTKNRHFQDKIMQAISSGSVGINETVKQGATNYLPFGGVGESGMGAYHGKTTFECFSQYKSIMISGYHGARFHYPPYNNSIKLLKKVYKIFN